MMHIWKVRLGPNKCIGLGLHVPNPSGFLTLPLGTHHVMPMPPQNSTKPSGKKIGEKEYIAYACDIALPR